MSVQTQRVVRVRSETLQQGLRRASLALSNVEEALCLLAQAGAHDPALTEVHAQLAGVVKRLEKLRSVRWMLPQEITLLEQSDAPDGQRVEHLTGEILRLVGRSLLVVHDMRDIDETYHVELAPAGRAALSAWREDAASR